MNIDQHLIETAGWTLVHSLWQAAIIFVLLLLAARSLGSKAAEYRYAGWILALFLVVASSIATFLIVFSVGSSGVALAFTGDAVSSPVTVVPSAVEELRISRYATEVLTWIDVNLLWVIRVWLIGSAALLLRTLSGVLYITFLRRNALPAAAHWEEKVNELARGLCIQRKISVAEGRVSTPMIIGYLKPLIVFPVGMIAGLAPQQVEAILLHELAHIRRHDFIVNAIQCVVESLFFFNPFVWMISARIRAEREYCCDDMVIRRGIEPLVYVRTLATVEGAYANGGRLALGLMGQRHQLLNRMKRVMEKTVVKKEWNGIRVLPLSLVLVGLVCASWLSVGVNPDQGNALSSIAVLDTTISNDTRQNEAGSTGVESREDEYYSFDHSFDAPLVPPFDPSIAIPFPPIPSYDFFAGDSIPAFHYYVPGGEWEKFEQEFTAKFKDEFSEFFEKNRDQFEKMMEEFHEKNEESGFMFRHMDEFDEDQLLHLKEQMALINPALENLENFAGIPHEAEIQALMHATDALAQSERALAESGMFQIQEKMMKAQELLMRDQEEYFRAYEQELIGQLTKDGYLKENEKVSDIHINNGEITVNGTKVKKEDEQKYKAIIDRHNNRVHTPHRPE